jgi:hypothetical protein
MTVIAGDSRVSLFEFEVRISVVLKQQRDHSETQRRVTGITTPEELTEMYILMAANAFHRQGPVPQGFTGTGRERADFSQMAF